MNSLVQQARLTLTSVNREQKSKKKELRAAMADLEDRDVESLAIEVMNNPAKYSKTATAVILGQFLARKENQ